MRVIVLAAVMIAGVGVTHAAPPYDGSVPMKCAIETVMVCDPTTCVRGTAQTALLPPVLTVDVGNRLISGAATGRTARITSTAQGATKLMISGQEVQTLGKIWGLVVEQETGAMSGAVLAHGDGQLIFGRCTAAP